MRYLTALTLALVMSTTAMAQAVPTAVKKPHLLTSKRFWIGEAIIATSVFLDYYSTEKVRHVGPESNVLLGTHPDTARITGVGIGAFAYWTGFNVIGWEMTKNDTRTWQFIGSAPMPAVAGVINGWGAAHNFHLEAQCRAAHLKC